ncbi:MAG TPA: LacI family DNA-binding transcriptional regulator [Capsulimonadaceae bacterium]|jgi:LacI family transcriptional regulator
MSTTTARKPTTYDVAKHASVSQATVSYVLNDRPGKLVSEGTRKRVLESAQALGYRQNNLAKAVSKGRTNTIGVFLPILGSRFHADVIRGLQMEFESNGLTMLFATSMPDAEARMKRVEFLINHRVDAMVLVSKVVDGSSDTGFLDHLIAEKTPVVAVDDAIFNGKLDCVISDDIGGMRLAVKHLSELGHTRIGFIPGDWPIKSTEFDRREGFRVAMAEFGLSLPPELFHGPVARCEELIDVAGTMLDLPDPPTALVAANDHLLAFVNIAMRRRGLRSPENVALVGFANQELSEVMDVTTIDQQPVALGRTAAQRIIARLSNPELPVATLLGDVSLVCRHSTIGRGAQ